MLVSKYRPAQHKLLKSVILLHNGGFCPILDIDLLSIPICFHLNIFQFRCFTVYTADTCHFSALLIMILSYPRGATYM